MYSPTIFYDHENELFKSDKHKYDNFFNINDPAYENLSDEKMMLLDTKYYLSDDILCKVDRASMNFSFRVARSFFKSRII